MAFTGPFEDRLAIRELVDSYGDAVARNDAQAWGANWAEDRAQSPIPIKRLKQLASGAVVK